MYYLNDSLLNVLFKKKKIKILFIYILCKSWVFKFFSILANGFWIAE